MSFAPAQCRAARALLDWSQGRLAEESQVATKTIANFERGQRVPYDRTLADIQRALEAAGVEFTNGGQPGVRISTRVIDMRNRNAKLRGRIEKALERASETQRAKVLAIAVMQADGRETRSTPRKMSTKISGGARFI